MRKSSENDILDESFEEVDELELPELEEATEMKKYPLPAKVLHYSWDQLSYILVGREGIKVVGLGPAGKKYPYPAPKYPYPEAVKKLEEDIEKLKEEARKKEEETKQKEESATKEKEELSKKAEELSKELEDAKAKISELQKPVQLSETATEQKKKELSLQEALKAIYEV